METIQTMRGYRLPDGVSLVLIALSAGAALSLVWLVEGGQNDFIYDWLTAKAFVSGIDPHQPIDMLAALFGLDSWQSIDYIPPRLPGLLLFLAPIGWVPFEFSYEVGRVLVVATAFGLAWVLARLAGKPPTWFFVAVPIVLLIWPFSTVLLFGQSAFLVAAGIGLTWYLGDRWTSGAPLGLAILLKMWPWLLVPALWLGGRRRAAYGTVLTFGVLNLIGLTFPNVTLDGVSRLLTAAVELIPSSVTAAIGLPEWVSAAAGLGAVVLLSMRTTPVRLYAWTVVIAMIVAPFIWIHYVPILIVPAVLLATRRRPERDGGGRVASVPVADTDI